MSSKSAPNVTGPWSSVSKNLEKSQNYRQSTGFPKSLCQFESQEPQFVNLPDSKARKSDFGESGVLTRLS